MKAIDFPGRNVMLAEDQPEYETLPCFVDTSKPEVPYHFCMQLSAEELAEVNANGGKLWLNQWTFGKSFQPIGMTITKQF